MKLKIIDDLAIFIDNIVPKKQLSKLQEFLLSGDIFTDASKVSSVLNWLLNEMMRRYQIFQKENVKNITLIIIRLMLVTF